MRFIPSIRSLLFALVVLAMSAAAFAQIGISSFNRSRQRCPYTSSHPSLPRAISGHLATGLTVRAITTGCQAPG